MRRLYVSAWLQHTNWQWQYLETVYLETVHLKRDRMKVVYGSRVVSTGNDSYGFIYCRICSWLDSINIVFPSPKKWVWIFGSILAPFNIDNDGGYMHNIKTDYMLGADLPK